MKLGYVIAIDGPSGAGKSSVAKELARRLKLRYIDTGAMYRAAAWAAERAGVDPADDFSLARFLEALKIRQEMMEGDVVTLVGEENVSAAIRTAEMGLKASKFSILPAVRKRLTALQQEMGRAGGVVMDGRDIGTVVLPEADFKFFLTASPEERARRRYLELRAKGENVELNQIAAEIRARDHQDSSREEAPLRRAPDAVEIDSTSKTITEVVEEMLSHIRRAEAERKK